MPGERDISIYAGDTYTHEIRLKDANGSAINISGRIYTGTLKISKTSQDTVATFSTNISNANGGVVTFTLIPSITSNISPGTYLYDFQEENVGVITTLLTGKAVVTGQVG